MSKTSPLGVLFLFSVVYFSVMSDAKMFDVVVDSLVKRVGHNVIAIAIVTAIIAIFSHLDGATVTTVLVTVPAMLPLYRKLNIRPQLLLLITGAGMGVMNLLPWGGPVARAAIVLEMDANMLWQTLIPIQIAGVFATVAVAVIASLNEIKYHGAGTISVANIGTTLTSEENSISKENPKNVIFNFSLTIILLGVLLWGKFPTYYVFMAATAIALVVNYPSPKAQKERLKAHAPAATDVATTILAAGVMTGILSGSGMLDAMTIPLLKIAPSFMGQFLHLIFGIFSLPLGLVLGTDSYFYGLMPLAMGVAEQYNIPRLDMAVTMLIGKNLSLFISPLVPATFMGLGLTNIELGDHIKYSMKYLWLATIIMLIYALLIGVIKFTY